MEKRLDILHPTAAWVKLEEMMGNECTILDCARISKSGRRVTDLCQKDFDLLSELLRNDHGTPFEHVVFRFHVSAPIFVLRQWMRHRIGTFNEYSLRYREPIAEYYIPPDLPRVGGVDQSSANDRYHDTIQKLFASHADLLAQLKDSGVKPSRAREITRCMLPVATFSEIIWTVNLRSLMNFILLRSDHHAQYEMQQYAIELDRIVKANLPVFHQLWAVKRSDR